MKSEDLTQGFTRKSTDISLKHEDFMMNMMKSQRLRENLIQSDSRPLMHNMVPKSVCRSQDFSMSDEQRLCKRQPQPRMSH